LVELSSTGYKSGRLKTSLMSLAYFFDGAGGAFVLPPPDFPPVVDGQPPEPGGVALDEPAVDLLMFTPY